MTAVRRKIAEERRRLGIAQQDEYKPNIVRLCGGSVHVVAGPTLYVC